MAITNQVGLDEVKGEAMRRVAHRKRILKRSYIHDALNECKGDMKRTWRVLKEVNNIFLNNIFNTGRVGLWNDN